MHTTAEPTESDHDHDHGHGHHHDHDHEHEHDHGHDERTGFRGRVVGLIYDALGDFDGFLLDTPEGERGFDARDPKIEALVERAWAEAVVTVVFVDSAEPWRPVRIVLRA